MIFLASPFTHDDPKVRHARYIEARDATIYWLRRGQPVFSPIVYGYDLHIACPDLPTTWRDWMHLNMPMLSTSDEVWVLCIDGWRDSPGVDHEVRAAHMLAKPVKHCRPRDGGVYEVVREQWVVADAVS